MSRPQSAPYAVGSQLLQQQTRTGHAGFARLELINWLIAALLCLVLGSAYLLDGTPTEHQARTDTAKSTQDAKQHAQQQARFDKAARKLCGGGKSAFELLADGAIQCQDRAGLPTLTAKVAL